jgi:transposase
VGQQVIREYIYSLAAVCPQDGQLASLIMPAVDTEIMSVFLAHTANLFAGDYCLMFLDGAGWHQARDLRVPPTIRLLALPPYSPELNPVECLWDHLRENYFANRVMTSLDEVEMLLCDALQRLIHNPDQVRSMTNFDWINTICLTAN